MGIISSNAFLQGFGGAEQATRGTIRDLLAQQAQTLRDERMAELQGQRDTTQHGRSLETAKYSSELAEGVSQRAEERGIINAPRKIEAETPAMVTRAQRLGEVRVGEHREIAAIDSQARIDEFTKLAPLKRQEAIDTEVAKLTAMATPQMIAATRAIAQAKHIVDPSYMLIPNADGTVTTFDTKSGRSTGTVKDENGNPVIRKDSEELKAAVSVINMANTNLKIAQAEHKATLADVGGDASVKAKADVAWKEAQTEARRLTAPAYAVLYRKADIPESDTVQPPVQPVAPRVQMDSTTKEIVINGTRTGIKATSPEDAAVKARAWLAKQDSSAGGAMDTGREPMATDAESAAARARGRAIPGTFGIIGRTAFDDAAKERERREEERRRLRGG